MPVSFTANAYIDGYEILVSIDFSNDLLNNGEELKTKNYIFNNGAYVRKAELINSKKINLFVEKLFNSEMFTLTISTSIKDIYNNSLINNILDVSVVFSAANLSNYNGFVRTSRSEQSIFLDSQRLYMSGDRGIEIFRKKTDTTFEKWGQFFNNDKITAMSVVNYPDDLIITDNDPPFIYLNNPSNGQHDVLSDTSIYFVLRDLDTGINLDKVKIYVNNNEVFSGISGWENNYYGNIEIFYKSLSFVLFPPINFEYGSTVNIKIESYDLLNNFSLNEYEFYIINN